MADRKDEIIRLQADIIRQATRDKLNRVGEDLWGPGSLPPEDAKPELSLPVPNPEDAKADPMQGLGGLWRSITEGIQNLNDSLKNEEPVISPPDGYPEVPVIDFEGILSGKTPVEPPVKTPAPKATEAVKPEGEKQAEEVPPPEDIEDLKRELHDYIGLDTIKSEVDSLINLVKIYQKRREHDLKTQDLSLHMVFSGNPGTGKTMVARLMGRIYHSLGLLKKGHLVEVDRSGLVAGFVGQTALKTKEVIDKALGGVLFIDEAYALTNRGQNDYGQEAVETLLKAMEDHRDELIVIVAGYTALMDEFVHSNPGLASRFNRNLFFPDYTLKELSDIFMMRANKSGYTLDDEAKVALEETLSAAMLDLDFGNARGVRNLFEKALMRQADRLAGEETLTRDSLMALTAEDITGQARTDKPQPEDELPLGHS